MTSPAPGASARYRASLFKGGTEVCQVLAFRLVEAAENGGEDPPRIPALCCFTIPLGSPVEASEASGYELVFENGARFPIRIRESFVRTGDPIADGRDILAELT